MFGQTKTQSSKTSVTRRDNNFRNVQWNRHSSYLWADSTNSFKIHKSIWLILVLRNQFNVCAQQERLCLIWSRMISMRKTNHSSCVLFGLFLSNTKIHLKRRKNSVILMTVLSLCVQLFSLQWFANEKAAKWKTHQLIYTFLIFTMIYSFNFLAEWWIFN